MFVGITWGAGLAISLASAVFWPLVLLAVPAHVYLQMLSAALLGQYHRSHLGGR